MAEEKMNYTRALQQAEPMERAFKGFQHFREVIAAAAKAESELASLQEKVRQCRIEFEALAQEVAQGESRLQQVERTIVERESLYRHREKVIEEGAAVEAVLADRKGELATAEEAIKAIREERARYKKMVEG